MKIVTVLGARPQFIKAGTVSRALGECSDIEEVIVHTGQHYDSNMSDVFFDEMKIPKPDYQLGIGGKTHGAMTGEMIKEIEEVLLKEQPDWVLVYGDTNSTLAGAIAASKLHIKIAHIEAGLRSFNMKMPEEVNRILTDRVSSILFCPTQSAVNNLTSEGVRDWGMAEVVLSGDVMQDGANFYRELAVRPKELPQMNDFVLCTLHRAENTDDLSRLRSIVESLCEIAQTTNVVLPLHPRTKKVIEQHGLDISSLIVLDPVGYLNMVWLIDNCKLVLTDSGGLQKEAFFFEKHCITMRDETEWVELVDNNFNVLVGADKNLIIDSYNSHEFNSDFDIDLYGRGTASQKIASLLLESTS
ncbi:non-hydrolyzing UDP-N-acetylglucosamine 2-epimerase [Vibrio coralliilyticus]|uniref:non-hydrolyzing UDP-N-acetylglucosamine 2-epimerase n=1 Tax=Vibrio coralliilyticus TaxID=190893 RepID=UPI00156159D9|nr:UDP-N-acetylglucosamine 2-epimerase (non-hydrolyzing) [Vibrio coralliilyticus]NRF64530.1 UDP-N-acetylglucosamine 2-epimerase (non-hydrolyzing) [Vibrio coralliilyticus]